MTREQQIKQIERLRRRYQRLFKPVVKEALTRHYRTYKESIRANGAQYVLNNPASQFIDPGITAAVQQIYVQTGVASATLEYRRLRRLPKIEKKKGSLGFNAQWTNDILSYFRLNLFNKVVLPIAETTQEVIHNILIEGIAQGWTIDEMIARIEEKLENKVTMEGRTERILRTEMNTAISFGHKLAANSYEFKTRKRWVTVHDGRERHWHAEANGQEVELDASFIVGGEMLDIPSDPEASAANRIHCRCHMEIVPVRNTAGRLVPKEPTQPVRVRGRLREQIQEIIRELSN